MILIPFYNEEENLLSVIQNCQKYTKNILCVDDGSNDASNVIAKNSGANILITHSTNCGQGTALLSGIRYFIDHTNYNYLITMDADGQHLIDDAIKMLNFAKSTKADAVMGSRFLDERYSIDIPLSRKIIIKSAILFERIFYGLKKTDAHNGLRVLNRTSCYKLFHMQSSSMAHATEISVRLDKANLVVKEYPCTIMYSKNAKGSQSYLNSLNIISDLLQRK